MMPSVRVCRAEGCRHVEFEQPHLYCSICGSLTWPFDASNAQEQRPDTLEKVQALTEEFQADAHSSWWAHSYAAACAAERDPWAGRKYWENERRKNRNQIIGGHRVGRLRRW